MGIVDGRYLPVVRFNGSVNINVYSDQVSRRTVWSAVRNIATTRQHGCSKMEPAAILPLLASTSSQKLRERIISRTTDHHWPPYSLTLSSLDFSVRNYATVNMKKMQTSTIGFLNVIVEGVL